ncbi:hypothetical protein EVAR_80398_1 [Eumeta japonica]|uniref:Uncharacterized protein n=1 Tax=Eumeta variegata TaxID=151549 RepID=A0A4C1VK67_EUMVA|nr:hypothetical protein EVAR_80398_1 [Eumeta japonica]
MNRSPLQVVNWYRLKVAPAAGCARAPRNETLMSATLRVVLRGYRSRAARTLTLTSGRNHAEFDGLAFSNFTFGRSTRAPPAPPAQPHRAAQLIGHPDKQTDQNYKSSRIGVSGVIGTNSATSDSDLSYDTTKGNTSGRALRADEGRCARARADRSAVRPPLEYFWHLWAEAPRSQLLPLDRIQRRASRLPATL